MHSESPRRRVGILKDSIGRGDQCLFQALALLYPVDFLDAGPDQHELFDALIVLNGDVGTAIAAAALGILSFVSIERGKPTSSSGGEVHFGASLHLDSVLRGQTMVDSQYASFRSIIAEPSDEILASSGGHPLWLVRSFERGMCHVVGVPIPTLCSSEYLVHYLNGRRFMELLPLLHFLQYLVKGLEWEGPTPSACFVFDDPSLHRRSYGFLDYQRLAEHATKHNYFVSVATIPLDTWWVNDRVAATLRSFSPRLSVLIHGNNHTANEMLLQANDADFLAVAAQAILRMERLTQKHGIPFLKVMEAPHGKLANELLPHLLVLGYEAALCTTALFLHDNRSADWAATFGLGRSEMLGGGMPVLPRIRMSSDWKNDVLLAAFLRQPIILAGHHNEAARGMEFLAEFANTVNRLESVTWSDIQGMLRSNYRQRIEGEVLKVRMYSRRIEIAIPPGITRLEIQRPWVREDCSENLTIVSDGSLKVDMRAGPIAEALAPQGANKVEIASTVEGSLHYSSVGSPAASIWPIARKAVMELRDRLSPLLPIVDRLRRRPDSKSL